MTIKKTVGAFQYCHARDPGAGGGGGASAHRHGHWLYAAGAGISSLIGYFPVGAAPDR